MNRTSMAAAVPAACLLLAGCTDTSAQRAEAGSGPVTERGPVSPDGLTRTGPRAPEVVVSSCMGDPVVELPSLTPNARAGIG